MDGPKVKRLLILACFVGAAVYVLNPSRTPSEEGELAASTAQTQGGNLTAQTQGYDNGSGPLRSSWAPDLQSIRQEPGVSGPDSQPSAPRETSSAQPEVQLDHASAPAGDGTEQEAIEWVKVTQGLSTRSEASLSSPIIRHYPRGSKAQVIGRSNGWVHLLDPTTQERGWVYHIYLVSIDDPGDVQPKVTRKPPPVKVTPTKSRKAISRKPTRTTESAVRTSDAVEVPKAKRRRDRKSWRMRRRGRGLSRRREAGQR